MSFLYGLTRREGGGRERRGGLQRGVTKRGPVQNRTNLQRTMRLSARISNREQKESWVIPIVEPVVGEFQEIKLKTRRFLLKFSLFVYLTKATKQALITFIDIPRLKSKKQKA